MSRLRGEDSSESVESSSAKFSVPRNVEVVGDAGRCVVRVGVDVDSVRSTVEVAVVVSCDFVDVVVVVFVTCSVVVASSVVVDGKSLPARRPSGPRTRALHVLSSRSMPTRSYLHLPHDSSVPVAIPTSRNRSRNKALQARGQHKVFLVFQVKYWLSRCCWIKLIHAFSLGSMQVSKPRLLLSPSLYPNKTHTQEPKAAKQSFIFI